MTQRSIDEHRVQVTRSGRRPLSKVVSPARIHDFLCSRTTIFLILGQMSHRSPPTLRRLFQLRDSPRPPPCVNPAPRTLYFREDQVLKPMTAPTHRYQWQAVRTTTPARYPSRTDGADNRDRNTRQTHETGICGSITAQGTVQIIRDRYSVQKSTTNACSSNLHLLSVTDITDRLEK
jgi:hypothetical protein